MQHAGPAGYAEKPQRLEGVVSYLRWKGWPITEPCQHELAEEIAAEIHDPDYIERFRRAAERGDGLFDSADNPLSPGTWTAAWAAVETVLQAADGAWLGHPAFAAVRPPGHHAERGLAMGFCYLNNVAVAAQYLRRHWGAERVAIYDFDVHHGNGTQHLFEERGDVLYVSSHQHPFYPGTGLPEERGMGAGLGATLNVALAAGDGDEALFSALEEQILPALRSFQPDVLLLSAGFDAWSGDPLGGLRVSLEGYTRLGQALGELAAELCGGKMLSVLEGGYDLSRLPELVASYLRGCSSGLGLPELPDTDDLGETEM